MYFSLLTWVVPIVLVVLVVIVIRRRPAATPGRRRGGVGTAAVGSVYGLLSEDKQRAVDIIVEEKAGERRPEYPAGDASPGASSRREGKWST